MLNAYKNHLKTLSETTFDDFSRQISLRLQFHLFSDTVRQSTSPGALTLIHSIPAWLTMAKKVVPVSAQKIDRMLTADLEQNQTQLSQPVSELFQEEVKPTFGERVQSAVNSFWENQNNPPPFEGQFATN